MRKFHYGWMICFACTLQLFISAGLPSAAFGVHLPYLIAENGFTNAQGSLIVSVRSLSSLAAMLLVDRFYTVLDARRGLFLSALCGVLSCLLYSRANTLSVYFAGAIFGGIALGLGGMIPVSILISKWFAKRRAFALSICSAGSGLATIVLPPVITVLIQWSDLKTAFFCESVFILLSAILVYTVLRNRPEDKAMQPYRGAERLSNTQLHVNRCIRQDMSKHDLCWMLAVAFCTGVAGNAITFLSMLYTDSGYTETFAAMIFSVTGVIITLGKFVIGAITDRRGGFCASSIAFASMVIGLVLSCMLLLRNPVLIVLSVLCLGLGITITTVVISYMAEDFSTEASYGRVLKQFQIFHTIGFISFGYVIGVLADFSGGYIAPFAMIACVVAIAFGIVVMMYRRKNARAAL